MRQTIPMTIHNEFPFPSGPYNPARRLRGMVSAPVSIWASGAGTERDGWTISSFLIADGDPAELVALVKDEADWWETFQGTETAVVNLLGPGQGYLADVFARVAPSPGGVFRSGEWDAVGHGPKLTGAAAWVGVRLADTHPVHAGWGLLVRATVEWIEFADGVPLLEYRAGRYSSDS